MAAAFFPFRFSFFLAFFMLCAPPACGGARSSLARSPLRVFLRRNASKEGAEKSAPPRRPAARQCVPLSRPA